MKTLGSFGYIGCLFQRNRNQKTQSPRKNCPEDGAEVRKNHCTGGGEEEK
jgi:hypothetical protein